jgi:hypothetical protein
MGWLGFSVNVVKPVSFSVDLLELSHPAQEVRVVQHLNFPGAVGTRNEVLLNIRLVWSEVVI